MVKMEKSRVKYLKKLQEKLSYRFKNIKLFNQALTHKSYANEKNNELFPDNERLEFLGDAVLDLIISDLIMEKFPFYSEGELSKLRAAIVNEQALSSVASSLEIGHYILLGKGEELSSGRNKNSILSSTYEAVVAAIYLDGGFKKVSKTITRHFAEILLKAEEENFFQDFKSKLQEYSQNLFKVTPKYILIKESGPAHNKLFEINTLIDSQIFGSGRGKSKKEAEQKAAKETLKKLYDEYTVPSPQP